MESLKQYLVFNMRLGVGGNIVHFLLCPIGNPGLLTFPLVTRPLSCESSDLFTRKTTCKTCFFKIDRKKISLFFQVYSKVDQVYSKVDQV